MSGKGDWQRPGSLKAFQDGWERTFGKCPECHQRKSAHAPHCKLDPKPTWLQGPCKCGHLIADHTVVHGCPDCECEGFELP